MNTLKGKDILTGSQFTREELEMVMELASDFQNQLKKQKGLNLLKGYILSALFLEPSTRTRMSFETAIHRLGGSVVGVDLVESTAIVKGESLEDTIHTIDQYVDFIAMRHPTIGSAEKAARIAEHPVLNGGDGTGQHPTQAILDLFTIKNEIGGIDGKTIVLCGDLKNGRTVHSGVEIFKHYKCKLIFVAPDQLSMPAEITKKLIAEGVEVEETRDLPFAISNADVLYMTRIQRERFADVTEYEKLKDSYILTRDLVETKNPNLTILHPLPRVNEIPTDVDTLSGAAYFRQAQNGVFTRMALLALVSGAVS